MTRTEEAPMWNRFSALLLVLAAMSAACQSSTPTARDAHGKACIPQESNTACTTNEDCCSGACEADQGYCR